jgi:hypothetical protein
MTQSNGDQEAALAAELIDASDQVVLNSVRAYFDENDPVPDGLVDRVQFELTLDALHTELATLMRFDMVDSGVRSAATEAVRTVTFTSESLTTMVTLTPQPGDTVRVDGWAAPGSGVRVEILLAAGPRETYADDDGRFVFDGVPKGLAKFALHVPKDDDFSTVLSPTIEL